MILTAVEDPAGYTVWAESAPARCGNGHELGPRQVIVSWLPCSCTDGHRGHRTHTCTTCEHVTFTPPHPAGPVGVEVYGPDRG